MPAESGASRLHGRPDGTTRSVYALRRPDRRRQSRSPACPIDNGMLASVDAQSRWERMPRCASTARMYRRIGAPSASLPPGREPTSFSLADTRPPVDRSFSDCRELSTRRS